MKSAKRENKIAQYNLGFFYKDGIGITKDEKKVFQLFLQSADRGYAELPKMMRKHSGGT